MWNQKLCLALSGQFGIDDASQIKLFAETGFDGFFSGWSHDAPIAEWKALADECGMMYQSIHAPFGNSAKMWSLDKSVSLPAVNELLDCLHDCAANEVPIMVCHTFIGFKDHSPTDAGIENYEAVAREAEHLGVMLGFENTEGEEYLAAVMTLSSAYKSVGFCWDTGHEMCYNHSKDMTALYGDRLICTHLNDNLGIRDFGGEITWIDDLHLLPFDGIADWDNIAARLAAHNFSGPLTFELNTQSKPDRHENDCYAKLPIEEYISEVYKRACRVGALFRKHLSK